MNVKTPSDRNTQHHNRAQSLVEFAIVLPVLLLLVLGAMDFGRLFKTKIFVTNAAREGANFLTRNPSTSAGTLYEIIDEGDDLNIDNISVSCVKDDEGACAKGETVSVTVTKSVDLIFGGFLQTFGITGGPFELSSTVKMMVQ
jgi:hypothetical protein